MQTLTHKDHRVLCSADTSHRGFEAPPWSACCCPLERPWLCAQGHAFLSSRWPSFTPKDACCSRATLPPFLVLSFAPPVGASVSWGPGAELTWRHTAPGKAVWTWSGQMRTLNWESQVWAHGSESRRGESEWEAHEWATGCGHLLGRRQGWTGVDGSPHEGRDCMGR